jgi:hypothetical protein
LTADDFGRFYIGDMTVPLIEWSAWEGANPIAGGGRCASFAVEADVTLEFQIEVAEYLGQEGACILHREFLEAD